MHHKIAHRGRRKTEKWIAENYSKIAQKVVNTFVSLCSFLCRTETHNWLVLFKLNHSFPLLKLTLEISENCPCECETKHKWTINIIDHHTKFVNVHSIHKKLADEVLNEVQKYCVTYNQPKNITDNGGELKNNKMKAFCSTYQIQLLQGAARTPTTQGLVEQVKSYIQKKKDT